MSQPTSRDLAVEIDLLYDLERMVKARFTPTVFNCACKGEQESCKRALNDPRVWERLDAVTHIAAMLLEMAREREEQQTAIEREQTREERLARWAQ